MVLLNPPPAKIGLSVFFGFALVLALFLWPQSAFSAFQEILPSTVDPRPQTLAPTPPKDEPLDIPKLPVQSLGGTAPDGADKIEATYRDIRLEGATVYNADVTALLLAPLLGKTAPLLELFILSEQLQARYLADGYFLTRVIVPTQESEQGVFHIRILEGYIGALDFDADMSAKARSRLEALFAPVLAERPLRLQTLERALLLANDQAGLGVVTTLQPAAEGAGAARLVIKAEEKRFSGSASVNNRGSRFAGPWRNVLTGEANGLWRSGDQVQLVGFAAYDFAEQQFAQLGYTTPLGADGLMLTARLGYGEGEPGYTLSPLDVETSSLTASAGVEYPLLRSRARSLWLTGSFNVSESHVRLLGDAFTSDRLRVLALGARATLPQTLAGDLQLQGGLRQGLSFLGGSDNAAPLRSRPEGNPDATVLAGEMGWQFALGEGFGLGFTGAGQYALRPVLSDEEFRLGGDRFGRGYNASEISGDHGLGSMVELTYGGTTGWGFLEEYQFYLFADYGAAWNQDVGDGGVEALGSTGIGVRAKPLDGLFLTLELARPLLRNLSSGEKAQGLGRVFFSLSSVF